MASSNYLLTAATLAGVAAGSITTAALTARATVPESKRVTVSKPIASDNPALVSIWEKVDAAMCDDAEAEAGFPADSCSIEPGTVLSITKGSTEDQVSVSFMFAGTFVKGTPE